MPALGLPRRYPTNRDPQPNGQQQDEENKHRGHSRFYFCCASSMSRSPSSLVHLPLLQSRYLLQGNLRTRTRSQHGLSRVSRTRQWPQRVRATVNSQCPARTPVIHEITWKGHTHVPTTLVPNWLSYFCTLISSIGGTVPLCHCPILRHPQRHLCLTTLGGTRFTSCHPWVRKCAFMAPKLPLSTV